MTSGGPRNRAGRRPDPASARSDREGFSLTALPAGGFEGEVPEFPLSQRRVYRWEFEDKRRFQVLDEEMTELVCEREAELWEWAWRTPQACAWSMEPWRWQTVAMWVRTMVICESDEATAADKGAIHRFADQVGLTPAGLRENGWAIAVEAAPSAESPSKAKAEPSMKQKAASSGQFKVIPGGKRAG